MTVPRMLRRPRHPSPWYAHSDLPISTLGSVNDYHETPGIFYERISRSSFLKRLTFKIALFSLIAVVFLSLVFLHSFLQDGTVDQHLATQHPLPASRGPNGTHDIKPSTAIPRKSLPPGRLPLVDRSILKKLASMDQFNDDFDDQIHPLNSSKKAGWPPLVTHIPEPKLPVLPPNLVQHQFQHEPISTLPLSEFDLSSCGSQDCRFILPLRIAEQESKSRLHFMQILEMAGRLNHIVVLPNVAKSRMGTCSRWTFDHYYDIGSLLSQVNQDRPRVSTMEAFRKWVATRPRAPQGQMISIYPKPVGSPLSIIKTEALFENQVHVKIDHSGTTSTASTARCLSIKFPRLAMNTFSPLSIHPSKAMKNKIFGPALVDALRSINVREASFQDETDESLNVHPGPIEPDVIVLNYSLRHPSFTPNLTLHESLSYSQNLTEIATELLGSSESSDYLAIHWRMETVDPDILPQCAEMLVETLAGLLQDQDLDDEDNKGIDKIWFASDYPHPISRTNKLLSNQLNGGSKSSTFRSIGPKHEEAIEIIRRAFEGGGPFEGKVLTGLAEELARARQVTSDDNGESRMTIGNMGELIDDAGVLGILDKIIAVRAKMFVSGGKQCGRAR